MSAPVQGQSATASLHTGFIHLDPSAAIPESLASNRITKSHHRIHREIVAVWTFLAIIVLLCCPSSGNAGARIVFIEHQGECLGFDVLSNATVRDLRSIATSAFGEGALRFGTETLDDEDKLLADISVGAESVVHFIPLMVPVHFGKVFMQRKPMWGGGPRGTIISHRDIHLPPLPYHTFMAKVRIQVVQMLKDPEVKDVIKKELNLPDVTLDLDEIEPGDLTLWPWVANLVSWIDVPIPDDYQAAFMSEVKENRIWSVDVHFTIPVKS